MRDKPPENLVSLLTRLQLASEEQVLRVAPLVRRLAADLPDFESVWIDALVQARVLTPYQGEQVGAGRGERLRYGPYVVLRPIPGPQYAESFAARSIQSGQAVRLYVIARPQRPREQLAAALGQLIEQSKPLRAVHGCVVQDAGVSGAAAWACCPAVEGTTASQWMVEYGRVPAAAVLQVSREIVARLVELEREGIVHGDLGATDLLIDAGGHALLPMPGLRGVVRPSEGYSFNDLAVEAYDYLAPERIADGTAPSIASDIYAYGCLFWHLLSGRPPLAGGNALGKLKAAHAAKIIDVRQLAPDVPQALASAIGGCLARDPADRPQSFAALAELLGAPTRAGAAGVSTAMRRGARVELLTSRAPRRGSSLKKVSAASAVVAIAITTSIALWPIWRSRLPSQAPHAHPAARVDKTLAATDLPTPDPNRPPDGLSGSNGSQEVKLAAATAPIMPTAPDDLLLPTDRKLHLKQLELKAGQRVRGRNGARPLVSIPAEGLLVVGDEACFEGVDFVWDTAPRGDATARGPGAISTGAQSLEFKNCSFTSRAREAPAAIAWSPAAGSGPAEIVFTQSICSGLDALVEMRSSVSASVEMRNVLSVNSGAILRLVHMPRLEESVSISLERTTLRGRCAVFECRYAQAEANPGPVAITADDCAMDVAPQFGLLLFAGSQPPGGLLATIAWGGQGTLITPETPVAVWRGNARKAQLLPEEDIDVAGLARSALEFAGEPEGAPGDSHIRRWQGPLHSADPPGADAGLLPLVPR